MIKLLVGLAFTLNVVNACALPPSAPQAALRASPRAEVWLQETELGLEKFRAPGGLIQDTLGLSAAQRDAPVQTTVVNPYTSPTNIGLDLLVKLEKWQAHEIKLSEVEALVTAIAKLPRSPKTSLFYGWYRSSDFSMHRSNLSSVDNIHLALALWTASKELPLSSASRELAGKLFREMDFRPFYDTGKKLMYGNLLLQPDGTYKTEGFHYAHYGSESRTITILSFAFGWIDLDLDALIVELFSDRTEMALWDGGAFQMFLPDLLISERDYSSEMRGFFKKYADRMQSLGTQNAYHFPAAHSACFSVKKSGELFYNGHAGLMSQVSHQNDARLEPFWSSLWETAYTPHALLLAALDLPESAITALEKSEAIQDENVRFFNPGLGFADAIQFDGPGGLRKGQELVVPAQVSLDQLISALALRRFLASDHLTVSARALRKDPFIRARLNTYYARLAQKIKQLP